MSAPPPVPPPFPYDDLPRKVVKAIEEHNKCATKGTVSTGLSLFFPIITPIVALYGFVKFAEATALTWKNPKIRNPKARFPGKTKHELKQLALDHPNLAKVMEFSQARMAFWISSLFLTLLIGFLAYLVFW